MNLYGNTNSSTNNSSGYGGFTAPNSNGGGTFSKNSGSSYGLNATTTNNVGYNGGAYNMNSGMKSSSGYIAPKPVSNSMKLKGTGDDDFFGALLGDSKNTTKQKGGSSKDPFNFM